MNSVLFLNSFFSIFIFLYSVLMVKWNFINQKACLINWVLQFYLYQILFSIIFWIPLNLNNQKHLQLIVYIYIKKVCLFFLQKYCTFTFFT